MNKIPVAVAANNNKLGRPQRPRLVFVAPWFLLPAVSGGRIRTVNILTGLKGGHFEIVLLSPQPDDISIYHEDLSKLCDRFIPWSHPTPAFWRRLTYLGSSLPLAVRSERSSIGSESVAAILAERPSVVVYDFVHTTVLAPMHSSVPSVVFTHNVEAEIYQRQFLTARNPLMKFIWWRQYRKMQRFEAERLGQFDRVIAVSERDREQFARHLDKDAIETIATGVDFDEFSCSPTPLGGNLTTAGGRLVFCGSLDWQPNIDALRWFMDEIWPLVSKFSADSRFTAAGRRPPPSLIALARRRALNWEFTGYVDDIRPSIEQADIFVLPLRVGGGTRLKVLQAIAMNRPLVSTSIGVEGLGLRPGEHYLSADTPTAFANAILALLEDAVLRRRLVQKARAYVLERCSTTRIAHEFERICIDVSGSSSTHSMARVMSRDQKEL